MNESNLCWVRHVWDLAHPLPRVEPPAGYALRVARPADGSLVLDIVMKAYRSDPVWHPILEHIRRRMRERICRTLGRDDAVYLMAERRGTYAGVSGVAERHWTDQNLLTGICILPAHQRRGVGTWLLGASLEWLRCRGLACAQVYTEADSVADRKIYPLFGSTREEGVVYPGASPTPSSSQAT